MTHHSCVIQVSLAAKNPEPDKRCKDAYEKYGKPVDPKQKFPTYKQWKQDMNDEVLSKGDKGDSLRKIFGPRKSRANLQECYEALLHQHNNPDDEDCLKITDQKKCMELECFWKPGYFTGDCLLEDPESGPEPDPVVADCPKLDTEDACKKDQQCEWKAGYLSKGSCDNKKHNPDPEPDGDCAKFDKDACSKRETQCEWKEGTCINNNHNPAPAPNPPTTIAVKDLVSCEQILCQQDPPITDNGASLIDWQVENPNGDPMVDECLAIVIKETEDQANAAAGEEFGKQLGSDLGKAVGVPGASTIAGAIGEAFGANAGDYVGDVEADGKAGKMTCIWTLTPDAQHRCPSFAAI
jgi:hypothetical protein